MDIFPDAGFAFDVTATLVPGQDKLDTVKTLMGDRRNMVVFDPDPLILVTL